MKLTKEEMEIITNQAILDGLLAPVFTDHSVVRTWKSDNPLTLVRMEVICKDRPRSEWPTVIISPESEFLSVFEIIKDVYSDFSEKEPQVLDFGNIEEKNKFFFDYRDEIRVSIFDKEKKRTDVWLKGHESAKIEIDEDGTIFTTQYLD